MKKLMILASVLLMTGCISERGFQPPPDAWEYFYKQKKGDVSFEIVKNDMLACGFESPNTGYISSNDKQDTQYIKAMLCMEEKNYQNSSIQQSTVCLHPLYQTKPACQNRQKK
ncbi:MULTISPECIES: hypothetical protein [unclassified Acinetobacter]|uniref:hypothetical protein n=1 Tax=unclassified Acinetobacter TaxID=196816 RepID=UPI0035BB78D7